MNHYIFKKDEFFIHFQNEDKSTAVIMSYEEESNSYFRLTDFAADVAAYLSENTKKSFEDIFRYVKPRYEGTAEDIKTELQKVLDKLVEHSIV